MKLLARGAEAELYLTEWGGRRAVLKRRVEKPYRHPMLDRRLRLQRTLTEARMLARAAELGVDAPALYEVRLGEAEIIMEYVEGVSLRWYVEERGVDARASEAAEKLGWMIGVLHENGFTHGDVTTSNVLLGPEGRVVLIDFGLASHSENPLDHAVDLHLFLRALRYPERNRVNSLAECSG